MQGPRICRWNAAAAVILAAQAALLAWGAWRHSPTVDEVGSIVAGISHWKLGRFDLYRVNAPLVRLVATLPLVLAGVDADLGRYTDSAVERPEYQIGDKFIRDHGVEAFRWFTVARWACIPFSLLGGWYCYRWASDLWGGPSGLVATGMWCVSPSVLAHGQLITTDVAGAAAGLAASYWFCRWIRRPTWGGAAAAGIVFGLAQLVKTTWIVLFARWPLVWLASLWVQRRSLSRPAGGVGRIGNPSYNGPFRITSPAAVKSAVGRIGNPSYSVAQLAAILALGLYVINLGYGFEGSFKRLGAYTFVSRPLAGADSWTEGAHGGNRFKDGWLGLVPLPLPYNYVQGLDRQKWELEDKQDSYLRGEWRKQGWWYYYLYGLGIKEPLGTWLLLGLSAVVALRRARGWLIPRT